MTLQALSTDCVLHVKRLRPEAALPHRAHPGDAGFDLFACTTLTIPPGESRLVPTGIAIQLPPRTEAQVRPRSGLALKHSITLLNAPGTIDEGYRGEVSVIVINHGRDPFQVIPGMKIAQLVVMPRLEVGIVEADTLSASARDTGGFGSTGV